MKQTLTVKGMHCNSCKMLITEALEETGSKSINVQLDQKKQVGIVQVETNLSKAELINIIEKQGSYKVI